MEILPKDRTPAPEGEEEGKIVLERVLDLKDEELF